ncbi:MAG: hypothetical protein JRF33_21615 [Deltaproteobacteria bacterium]|nr:hypothetical protein [Deltaproteobacteria bacterium]
MNRPIGVVLCACFLLITAKAAGESQVDVNGSLESNVYVGLVYGDLYDFRNTNILYLKFSAQLSESLATFGELKVRNTNMPAVGQSSDLVSRAAVEPVDLYLGEAYVDLFGFLLDDLDVRVGKQRIAWGTADGLNPTDNLNPFDFSNPLDFAERIPSTAIKLTYYMGDGELSAICLPYFTPTLLPASIQLPFGAFSQPPGLQLGEVGDQVQTPDFRVENVAAAAKLKYRLFDFDWSVSYYRGWDTLPMPAGVDLTPGDAGAFDAEITLTYSEIQVVGFDMAGQLLGIGVWAEVATFFSDKVMMTPTLAGQPLPGAESTVMLDGDPWVKAVVGGDYTFKGGYYVNLQYMHGFIFERGMDNLQDYVMAAFKKKFLNDELEVVLQGGLEIQDEDHIGGMAGLEFNYSPVDSVKVTLGGLTLKGQEGTTFEAMHNLDQVYFRFKADF